MDCWNPLAALQAAATAFSLRDAPIHRSKQLTNSDEPGTGRRTSGLGCRARAPEADGQQQSVSLGLPGVHRLASAYGQQSGTKRLCLSDPIQGQGLGQGPWPEGGEGGPDKPPHQDHKPSKDFSYPFFLLKFCWWRVPSLTRPGRMRTGKNSPFQSGGQSGFSFYSNCVIHPCFSPNHARRLLPRCSQRRRQDRPHHRLSPKLGRSARQYVAKIGNKAPLLPSTRSPATPAASFQGTPFRA